MSGILRSGKFIRCFSSVIRTYLGSQKTTENNLILSADIRPLSTGFTQAWNKHNTQQQTDSLEPLLQRLDADVRKFGRLSRKDLDEMIEEIRQKHHVSSSQSLLIIRCCGDLVPEELPEIRTKLVKEIWNTLVQRGVPMDISHYNALLRVYIENEHDFSPEDFLKELEGKGISPNRVTYQRLMWRYCQHGDVEGASHILEMMRSNQLPLSSAILDALVLGHARLGDVAGARAVVTAMASAGLEPGPRTYALLAGCSGGRGDTEELKKILQECTDKEIYLSDKDLMDIIEDCAAGGHEENIEFLLGQMQHTAGYNTDAVTLILRLIALGRDKAALLVFRSLSKPANPVSESVTGQYKGAFFIKQLVKAERPKEVIISMCEELQKDGSIPKAFTIASDSALFHGNQELALNLFHILKDSGETVRQHYFWPLIITLGKEKNHKEILNLVKEMTSNFKIGISMETLRDYVLPQFKSMDPNTLFEKLVNHNVPALTAGKSIVCSLLSENKLRSAANFTKKYGLTNSLSLCRPLLVNVVNSAEDIDPLVTIIHSGINSPIRGGQQTTNEVDEEGSNEGEERSQGYKHIVGNILYNIIKRSDKNYAEIVPTLLESLHSVGIGITVTWAEKIQELLGGSMTNAISEMLAKLTIEIEPKSFQASKQSGIQRTPENLENIIKNVESRGDQSAGLKRKLITAYLQRKQTDKLEVLLDSLAKDKFVFTAGLYCILQEYYAQEKDLDKALMYYNKVMEMEPNFVIDDIKILRIINLLVANDKIEKAMEILSAQPQTRDPQINSFVNNSMSWRILNTLADSGNVENLQQFFNKLKELKYIEANNSVLGPLVKVHLVKNDIENALKEFERMCQEFKCTPMKNELTKKLIALEDANGLQKLTDLSTSIHGEVNSLYDLVFSFVECGRVRQARRILETPGMRTRNIKFNNACERYAQEGKTDYLEGLLEATKELSHIDRSEVFQQLLNTYIKEENPEKAIGLWTLIQEESESPTDKFLIDLAEFLKSKNIEVPFVVPIKHDNAFKDSKIVKQTPNLKKTSTTNQVKGQNKVLEHLNNNDTDKVLELWRKSVNFSRAELTMFIEQLIQNQQCDVATEVVVAGMKRNYLPFDRIIRYLLNNLAQNGDLENINRIENHLSEEQRKMFSFDNRKSNAVLNSVGHTVLLDDLSNNLNTLSGEQLVNKFPMGAFLAVLSKQPEAYSKCMELVEKYHQKGVSTPANACWIHSVINGEDEKAQSIWNQYLMDSEYILFKKILRDAKQRSSTELIDKTLGYLKTHNKASPTSFGVVYSAKIDVLMAANKLEEANNVLKEALSNECQLTDINRSSLLRLKQAFEKKGQEFTYEIPQRK